MQECVSRFSSNGSKHEGHHHCHVKHIHVALPSLFAICTLVLFLLCVLVLYVLPTLGLFLCYYAACLKV